MKKPKPEVSEYLSEIGKKGGAAGGKKGGSSKSEKKKAAAKINGAKGGRPRKVKEGGE